LARKSGGLFETFDAPKAPDFRNLRDANWLNLIGYFRDFNLDKSWAPRMWMQHSLKLTKKWSIGTSKKHQFVLRYLLVSEV